MGNNAEIIHESEVKELIIELRGEKVLIDRDVATLYGVEKFHRLEKLKFSNVEPRAFTERSCI